MAEGGTMLHEKQNIKSVHINSASHARNEARIKQDEEELKELMKQARAAKGITDEEDTEDKPSSEEPEAEPVQAEGDTEQKEEPKAEAQEDDSGLSAEEKNFKIFCSTEITMLFSMFQLIVQVFCKSIIIIVAKLLVMLDMDFAS